MTNYRLAMTRTIARGNATLVTSGRYRPSCCPTEWLTLAASLHLILILVGCGNPNHKEAIVESSNAIPVTFTDKNFQTEVIESDLPVLVDMWAPWCQPCIEMKPTLRQFAHEVDGQIKVGELNIDNNTFITEKYEINKYPTLILFVDGEQVKRIIGSQSKDSLQKSLREHIRNEEDHLRGVQQ